MVAHGDHQPPTHCLAEDARRPLGARPARRRSPENDGTVPAKLSIVCTIESDRRGRMGDIPNWHIVGDWFDNCSCAVPCPCTFAQAPDNGFCESVLFCATPPLAGALTVGRISPLRALLKAGQKERSMQR